MKITRDVAVWAWLVIATPLLIASSHSLAKTSVRFQQEITSLVGAPAPDCTWDSAISELKEIDSPLEWSVDANSDPATLNEGRVVYRMTVYDYPALEDRWDVESFTSFGQAACTVLARVKQLEARR